MRDCIVSDSLIGSGTLAKRAATVATLLAITLTACGGLDDQRISMEGADQSTASDPADGSDDKPLPNESDPPTVGGESPRIPLNLPVEMPADEAQDLVDFPIVVPDEIPNGWRQTVSQVIHYDRNDDGVVDFTHFELGYRPHGAAETDHAGLTIIQADDTGRPGFIDSLATTTLADDTIAYLTELPEGQIGGAVTWWREDGYYVVSAAEMDLTDLESIANSMVAALG